MTYFDVVRIENLLSKLQVHNKFSTLLTTINNHIGTKTTKNKCNSNNSEFQGDRSHHFLHNYNEY